MKENTPPVLVAFALKVPREVVVEGTVIEESDEFLNENQQCNGRRDSQIAMKVKPENVDPTGAFHLAEE
jgi:hypothetical protein